MLGPILSILYTADLIGLVEQHGFRPHLYADDTQVYGSYRPSAVADFQVRLSACVDDVAAWMLANRLQLNTGKTDLLWCATAHRCHQLPMSALRIGSDFVNPSKSVGEILEFTSTPTSACDATFRKPLPAASPFFVSCAEFDVWCRRPFAKRSSSPSSCPGWTTAML